MAQRAHLRLLALLFLSLFTIGALCGSTIPLKSRNAAPVAASDADVEKFQELLNTVEPASLHEILHEHLKEKYKHGVYQEDKKAMEVVHEQDAEVANTLIELAKRQTPSNGTSVTPTTSAGPTVTIPSTSTVIPSTSTIISTSSSAAPPSTSSSQASSTTPTTSQSTTAPASTSQDSTSAPTTTTPTTSAPIESSSSTLTTSGSTSRQGSSSRPDSTTSTGGSSPATNTPSTESPSSVTQQVVFKTTLANGAQTTVTSVTVVPANQATGGGSGSKTNGAGASLQTNAAAREAQGVNVALLGALGIVVAVL